MVVSIREQRLTTGTVNVIQTMNNYSTC